MGKKNELIEPPHWYKGEEENIGELEATSVNVPKLETNPKKVKQWPDPEVEVGEED